MNENEIIENVENVVSADIFPGSVSGNDVDSCGSSTVEIPSGNSIEDIGTVAGDISSGDAVNVTGYEADTGILSVTAGDSGTGGIETVVQVDYTENLQVISEGISQLNNAALLIFFFLLLSWAEKKISVTVNRFTSDRKR